MVKNKKAKGSARERKVVDRLTEQDYYAIKSGGSLGIMDVVGIYTGKLEKQPLIRIIQSKSNGHYSKSDVEALRFILNLINEKYIVNNLVRFELWDWIDYAREPKILIIGFQPKDDFFDLPF